MNNIVISDDLEILANIAAKILDNEKNIIDLTDDLIDTKPNKINLAKHEMDYIKNEMKILKERYPDLYNKVVSIDKVNMSTIETNLLVKIKKNISPELFGKVKRSFDDMDRDIVDNKLKELETTHPELYKKIYNKLKSPTNTKQSKKLKLTVVEMHIMKQKTSELKELEPEVFNRMRETYGKTALTCQTKKFNVNGDLIGYDFSFP